MAQLRVDGAALEGASSQLRAAGREILGDAEAVAAAFAQIAVGGADPRVASAAYQSGRAWGEALGACGAGIAALGGAVGAAATRYGEVERAAAETFGAHR